MSQALNPQPCNPNPNLKTPNPHTLALSRRHTPHELLPRQVMSQENRSSQNHTQDSDLQARSRLNPSRKASPQSRKPAKSTQTRNSNREPSTTSPPARLLSKCELEMRASVALFKSNAPPARPAKLPMKDEFSIRTVVEYVEYICSPRKPPTHTQPQDLAPGPGVTAAHFPR